MKNKKLNRRLMLRGLLGGASVGIALPTLDIFLNSNGTAYAAGEAFPKRFGVFFWGNGVLPERWNPATTGSNWQLSDQLQPLAGVKDYINVVSGMNVLDQAGRGHHEGTAGILSGADYLEREHSDDSYASTFRAPSIDQVIAKEIGGGTRFRSLEVGVSRKVSTSEGTTLKYLSHNGPDNANPPEYSPQALFNRLFGAGFKLPNDQVVTSEDPSVGRRRSVLDVVMNDAASLRKRLGISDQQRLDQHLEGVRSLERRLSNEGSVNGSLFSECRAPTDPGENNTGGTEPLKEVSEAMAELLAMALACDQTRVFSNMFSGSVSRTRYPGTSENHHSLTHNEPGSQPQVHKATVFIMERFNDLVTALKSIPEGDGTLLDNCCVLATSDTSSGREHSENDFPILVAGGAGGALKYPGIHYRSPNGENASKLLLTLMRSVGLQREEFGMGNGRVTSWLKAIESS